MFSHPKLVVTLAFLTFAALNLVAAPFQVLEETPDYIKVRFILPDWEFESIRENNQQWQKITSDFGSSLHNEGYPLLKSFSEAIGIPVEGDISIEVISQKKEVIENVKIYPTAMMNVDGMDVKYTFYQDLKAYNNRALYPANFAEKGKSAFIGNRRFVPLKLYPFQYIAQKKELMVTTEAELIIYISGDKSPKQNWQTETNFIDNVSTPFFLNNTTSQVWRKEKEKSNFIPKPKSQTSQISELQLVIDTAGIYKITYQYLKSKMDKLADSLGVEFSWTVNSIDPRYLQVSNEFGPVAIHFQGEADGEFNENDFFEFYGDRHYGDTQYNDEYTAENVYTISILNNLGARLAVENGGLTISNPSKYIVPDAYEHTVHLEQQMIPDKLGRSWSALLDFYREDIWFWRKITAPNLEIIPFELQYPKDTTIRTFSTKLSIFGLTYLDNLPEDQFDHKATVRLNQSLVNTISWRGQKEQVFENQNPIPNSYLLNGTNYFYISMNGETPMGNREQILLDYIELKYWREYKTNEDFISFTKPSNRPFGLYQFKVEGFSTNQVSVYKIGSSIFNSLQVEPFTLSGSQPWTVTFQDSVVSNDVKYYAVTENLKKKPKSCRINYPSVWHSSENSADCILITSREFISSPGTLQYKQIWETQGYQVELVDVQDIYDEFNYGIRSAESIKEFLKYAYNNWQEPQLKSVILLGDGTDDERDNSSSRKYNIVPVKKLWTYKHGATACDNWYGCVVGDDPLPEISIARINIWTSEQINQVAQKSFKYNTQPNFNNLWHGHVLLASGGKSDDVDDLFSKQSETIRRRSIPGLYKVSRIYTNIQSVSHEYYGVTSVLMNRINDGAIFLQFMGHGGGRIWADYDLFNLYDVASLNNQNYPIISSLACYCSAFDTNGASSISEALVLQPGKGAIATIGFSGLGYLNDDLNFGLALTESLFSHNFSSLGESMNFTKAKFYTSTNSIASQQALTHGCALLGDANIKIIKPQMNVTVNTNKERYSVGDTMRVTATLPQDAIAARTYVLKTNEIATNTPFDGPALNGTYNYAYKLPGNTLDRYQRTVVVAGYSEQGEFFGSKDISFGRGLISHKQTIPIQPAWTDSIKFIAKISGFSDINSIICSIRTDSTAIDQTTWINIPMVVSPTDSTLFTTSNGLQIPLPGKEIYFKYKATNSNNSVLESKLISFTIGGAELLLADLQLNTQNDSIGVKVLVRNVGNAPSLTTDIKLYARQTNQQTILLKTISFAPLDANNQRWESIFFDNTINNNVTFEANINIPFVFPELDNFTYNNILTLSLPLNYFLINQNGGTINSIDGNLSCEIQNVVVDAKITSFFYVNNLSSISAKDEPDVYPIILKSGVSSVPYEVKTLDTSLIDSLGYFKNGNMKLTFYYHPTDNVTQLYEAGNTYKIYRWESVYKKWVMQGGNVSTIDDKVVFIVNRQGIYSILRNMDKKMPSIDVNVQDQEFTVGGYISGKGTISIILSDANGIDIFDNSIRLFLDGNSIPETQWVKTINSEDINRIPLKYQLNLPKGNYTLIVDCYDVNGNFNSRDIQFFVNDKFDVINFANYPNPILGITQDPKNAGRTRFTYVLTDDADEVTIKIYTVSGRLVKSFKNLPSGVGYHEYPRTVYAWDCTDEKGFYLANGVYFYNIIAKKGTKVIEKIQKMAISK